ncbi:MAG: cell division protein SepF [Candidatus Methanofastidiosia archaeon]
MRKLHEVFGDKVSSEKKESLMEYEREEKEPKREEKKTGGVALTKGLNDIDAVKYDEDMLSHEEFLEYGIIYVKPMKLRALADVQKINKELNDGNIVLGDITPLLNRDPVELKRAVDQIKGICRGIGGDIIGIGESKILVTPTNIKIYKKTE